MTHQNQASAMTDGLPPLPHTTFSWYGVGGSPLYTSDQMRDYARAALATPAQQTEAPKDGSEKDAFEKWADQRGVWPRLTHEEIFKAGYSAALLAQASAQSWSIDLSKCDMVPLEPAIAPAIVAQSTDAGSVK